MSQRFQHPFVKHPLSRQFHVHLPTVILLPKVEKLHTPPAQRKKEKRKEKSVCGGGGGRGEKRRNLGRGGGEIFKLIQNCQFNCNNLFMYSFLLPHTLLGFFLGGGGGGQRPLPPPPPLIPMPRHGKSPYK